MKSRYNSATDESGASSGHRLLFACAVYTADEPREQRGDDAAGNY